VEDQSRLLRTGVHQIALHDSKQQSLDLLAFPHLAPSPSGGRLGWGQAAQECA
jgi:5-formyltetrahydrofolate cyclo-ligase